MLSHPLHFAAIVVARFVDESQLVNIIDSRITANDIYSQFMEFVIKKARGYPCLFRLCQSVDEAKEAKKTMRKKMSCNPHRKIVVHGVDGPPAGDESSDSLNKKILIDPTNKEVFPTDSFYQMSSDTSHIVEPKATGIEFHVFVDRVRAPTDTEIAVMIKKETKVKATT
jgi:hypothetical protein